MNLAWFILNQIRLLHMTQVSVNMLSNIQIYRMQNSKTKYISNYKVGRMLWLKLNEQQRKNRYRKKRAMLRRVQNKVSVAFFIIVIGLLALATRILIINYSKSEAYSREVLNHQSYTLSTIPYKKRADT